jgi:hypothetical protein
VDLKFADGAELRVPYREYDAHRQRLIHEHGELTRFRREPSSEATLRATLAEERRNRDKESRPAVFKVGIRTKAGKPSIRQQIAAGKEQVEKQRATAPQRAAAKSHGMEV